jgi:lysophospholipase L1-like esterase
MKPIQILVFLIWVLMALSGFQLLIPQNFTVLGITIKRFDFENLLSNKSDLQITNNQKIKLQNLQIETDRLLNISPVEQGNSIGQPNPTLDTNSGRRLPEISFNIDSASGIQYPAGDSTILYSFFKDLDSLKSNKKLIRILHFGDSQIEGDRISGYIRQRLQQQFGGCGPGLLPFYEEHASRFPIEIKSKYPAERYLNYGKVVPIGHRNYSVLHSTFRLKADTGAEMGTVKNSFYFGLNKAGFNRSTYFEKATILFRNPNSKVSFNFYPSGKEKTFKVVLQNDSFKMLDVNLLAKKHSFSFSLESGLKNDFFGVCLDCNFGVAVDNIPLRGSSGLDLLKIRPQFLQEQIRRLNVELIILQFGINVVPYEVNSFSWYESSIVKVIQLIKKSKPGIQVLVVGVSDMAKKFEGRWESYPSINLIRSAQKNAATRTNSAYWDLYQVMGGENSIQAWANTTPALAGKDYIHLTPKGAQVVGEFLFQALIKAKAKSI